MSARKTKLETRLLQQAMAGVRLGEFLQEVNALLLDGWRVVPGTYYHTRVPTIARDNTPAIWVTANGTTYRDHYFIVLEREESFDPEAVRGAIEAAEGWMLPELHRTRRVNGEGVVE